MSAPASKHVLSVVIPTFNAVGQVDTLIQQLLSLDFDGGLRIIIADDASGDGTPEYVADRFPAVTVAVGKTNTGFGANVNRGVELADTQYLAIVNSDVELIGNPFPALLDRLEQEVSVFAAMPLIYNTALDLVENLTELRCHFGLPWHERSQWTQAATALARMVEVQQLPGIHNLNGLPAASEAALCGAAFVCRRADFVELRGFDQRYRPFYWEDVDLGYRAARRGQRCETVAQVMVVHRHSETIDRTHGNRKLGFMLLNQLRFTLAHRGALRSAGLRHERLWWLIRAVWAILSGKLRLASAYLRAHWITSAD